MVCWSYFSPPDGTEPANNGHVSELLTISLIVFLAKASKMQGLEIPRILKTITIDAILYFLVIFTSHFTLMITLLFAPVSVANFFSAIR